VASTGKAGAVAAERCARPELNHKPGRADAAQARDRSVHRHRALSHLRAVPEHGYDATFAMPARPARPAPGALGRSSTAAPTRGVRALRRLFLLSMFVDLVNQGLFFGALLLLAALMLGAWTSRWGIPSLLVFLMVGMLAGEDGPGGIVFDDHRLSFAVGNLALAVILLDGGLRTRVASFRVAFKPALVLATVGVALTAALVAAGALLLWDLDWRLALLLGAIVGSTDAAAVFALLKSSGVRLNDRVGSTLEVESGVNDPMAVLLTVTLIGIATATLTPSAGGLLLVFVQQFGVGLAAGLLLGLPLSWLLQRVRLGDGLSALLVCAGGVAIFALTNRLGGSGFLAVYLVGLVCGNGRAHASDGTLRAMDGLAWLAQAAMFLLLGLLATPSKVVGNALPALGLALLLMFVARPVVVALCLAPMDFARREVLFIGWVGLRGAVPIVLAIFPLLYGVPQAALLFDVAFVIVLASLLVQGATIAPAARLLKVALPARAEPVARMPLAVASAGATPYEVLQFDLPTDHAWIGANPAQLELPTAARLVGVLRTGATLAPAAAGALQTGDSLLFVAPEAELERLNDLMTALPAPRAEAAAQAALRFAFGGEAALADVLALYAPAQAAAVPEGLTLEDAIRAVRPEPVEGDEVVAYGVRLTVTAMDGGRINRVTLTLPAA
jgi:cell volume regulation protein A